jgi:hypothetical protein
MRGNRVREGERREERFRERDMTRIWNGKSQREGDESGKRKRG